MKDKGKAFSFTAWGIKDTTDLPYIITHGDLEGNPDVVSLFHTRQAVRDWIKENRCGYVWKPVKVWIQEI